MIKNLYYIVLTCLIVLFLSATNKNNSRQHQGPDKISFGVKIGILPTGGLTQYAMVFYKKGKRISIQEVSLTKLVKIGKGEWPLPRTTTFHDFFEEFNLYNDTLPDGRIIDYGAAFDSLWKIRFNVHPFDHSKGEGWSQGEIRPSLKQQAYIYNRYGVRGYDQDYFADTSFFKLLKDVMNPKWIQEYKSLN
ncbi:hypothetical protein CW751_00195 [Brumimicrobium salinarum]|uniref:Uncharacterized protein n=1 Tax=Brumimicrobium salinarum TaxID=2058658 RepID=A0A2I0R5C9_9FLAO|nr:hypothetical protein [Brumimicrobium salinarum]PKR81796.1 hypothetical protein CW751_00195 [Brumimicrobium salinarum]